MIKLCARDTSTNTVVLPSSVLWPLTLKINRATRLLFSILTGRYGPFFKSTGRHQDALIEGPQELFPSPACWVIA